MQHVDKKQRIREMAHPRTLSQLHSKTSLVPVGQRKPNQPNKQTFEPSQPSAITTPNLQDFKLKKKRKKHNHKMKVHILDGFAWRVFHKMTLVILKSYVIISK